MTEAANLKETLGIIAGRRRWIRHVRLLVILLILVGGCGYFLSRESSTAAHRLVRYRTEVARTGDLTVTVTATGQLKPTRTVDVGSEVSGIIDEVLVNYNEAVREGQILAKINTEKLDAQVLQDRAQLQSARARVDDTKVTVVETEAKHRHMLDVRQRAKAQVVSQVDVEAALAAYERAKVAVTSALAAVTQAEATLKMDETNVAKAVIRSPVNGIVLARNVEPGQTIAASFSVTTMFQIAEDLRTMKLEVNVDEADVGQVKNGQNVDFAVDAYPGRRFPGRITQLRYNSTTSNNNVVTYLAAISVENHQLLLRPGMTATATVTVRSLKDVLLVPNRALRFLPSAVPQADGLFGSFMSSFEEPKRNDAPATLNNPRVWIVQNDKPSPIPVALGVTNGKLTEIKSGNVTPGTPLIVETLKESK